MLRGFSLSPTPRPRSALWRFLAYVRPYSATLAFATFCGILKFLLPATLAITQRFVIDRLVPQLVSANEHTDFSYRATMRYLGWVSAHLPRQWNASTPWAQLNILMGTLTVV